MVIFLLVCISHVTNQVEAINATKAKRGKSTLSNKLSAYMNGVRRSNNRNKEFIFDCDKKVVECIKSVN